MKNLIKRMHFAIYILLAVLLGALGCNSVTEGNIVDKWYEKPTQNLVLIPMKVGNTTIMQQYWIYDGEDYCIKIKGINNNGKDKLKTIYLRKEIWEKLQKGQYFYIDDNCSENDFTYEKKKAVD